MQSPWYVGVYLLSCCIHVCIPCTAGSAPAFFGYAKICMCSALCRVYNMCRLLDTATAMADIASVARAEYVD